MTERPGTRLGRRLTTTKKIGKRQKTIRRPLETPSRRVVKPGSPPDQITSRSA